MKSRYIAISGCVAAILFASLLLRPSAPDSATMRELVELPRPNSGSYTFEQAEAREGEIYRMTPTGRLADWKPPDLGIGFCVHIAKNDSIIVEHFRMPFSESNVERRLRDGVKAFTGNRYGENPTHVYRDVSLTELEQFVAWGSVLNQPAFVVLTSELEPGQSRLFSQVLERLFKPSIMLHYVPEKQQIESSPRE